MCINCFIKKFVKPIVNNKVIECAELIDKVYEHAPAGGYGHIVFDDCNIEDHCIDFCLKSLENNDFGDQCSEEEKEVTKKCLLMFKELTEDERHCAIGIHDGFIDLELL